MYKSQARTNYKMWHSPFDMGELGPFLCESLQIVVGDLNTLSIYLQACRKGTRLALDQTEYLEDTFAETVHRLASFPYPEDMIEIIGQTSTIYYLQHTWRVAAYIFLDTFIRHNPDRRWISSCTCRRLIDALCDTETMDWAPYETILLWILFVGFAAGRDREESLWFVQQADSIARRLQLRTIIDLKRLLKRQLWREDVFETPLLELGSSLGLE
jgi:hypothetical protein